MTTTPPHASAGAACRHLTAGILRRHAACLPRQQTTDYVNPDGTTNLEFDPEWNLFTGLGEKEVVKHA